MFTPEDPLQLFIQFKQHGDTKTIPALKNKRSPFVKNGKLLFAKNKTVRDFIDYADILIDQQLSEHPDSALLPIPLPMRVCVWVDVFKYKANPDSVPISDLDNQYTTIQEILQGRVVENDRQVVSYFVQEHGTIQKDSEHARVSVWVANSDPPNFSEFIRFNEKNSEDKLQVVSFPSLLEL